MRKVYILTFHRALNYGAVLQCYALYKTIAKMCNCEVIDYRSKAIENRYRLFAKHSSFKSLIKSVAVKPRTITKRKKFDSFLINNVSFTSPLNNEKELKTYNWEDESIFCVGSDQVWNQELTENDSAYFLNFVPNQSSKISYAASLGIRLDSEHSNYIKNMVAGFKYISVRENSAVQDFSDIGVKCFRNIDPVYLLEAEIWKQVMSADQPENSPYVLLYLLQKDSHLAEGAYKYAKVHNLRLVIIQTGLRKDYVAEYIENAGPEEFVSLFYNAKVIFTNSFHGISFSILFHKLFFFNYQGNAVKTNSRLRDSIEMFGLQKQEYTSEEEIHSEINYEYIDMIIRLERHKAIEYLEKSIAI